jgi:hypothetical protein
VRVWITDRWMGSDKVTGRRSVRKSLYGQGARWQVSFYAEQPDGSRALRSKNFETKSDAEAFRTLTEHELRAGIYRPPEALTRRFDAAAQTWWKSKRRPTGASLHRYRDALDIWVLPMWGQRTLAGITRPDVEGWVTQLIEGQPCTRPIAALAAEASLPPVSAPSGCPSTPPPRTPFASGGWLPTPRKASSCRGCTSPPASS